MKKDNRELNIWSSGTVQLIQEEKKEGSSLPEHEIYITQNFSFHENKVFDADFLIYVNFTSTLLRG